MFWFYNDPFFMEDWGSEPRISECLRLPTEVAVADLEAALAASAERHEALRTFYERPGSQAPRQLVLATYQPPITIGSPDAVQPVSMFDQPSFRCQATVEGSSVLSAVLVANQIDLDGTSMAKIAREVEDSLAPDSESNIGIAAGKIQPIDLAELEHGANLRAKARGQRAIQYVQALRAHAPRNFLPALSWKYSSGITRSATLQDETLSDAAESIAHRCGVSVPSVFHAGICKVVSDWTRTSRFLFSTAIANRWGRNVRDYVGRLSSAVECWFELAPDDTYRSMIERTHRSLIRSYFFGNRDIGACTMDGARVNEIAGSSLAKPILIEYMNYSSSVKSTWSTDGRQAFAETEPGPTDHLWFNISPFSDTTNLNVRSDAALLSEADGIEILEQLADFILQAADELECLVQRRGDRVEAWGGIPGTRWLEIGDSRFSANRIETNIKLCHGVSASAVYTSGTDSLVAYIAGPEANLIEIHEHLLIETSNDFLVKIPSLYILTSEAPAFEDSEDSWKGVAVVDQFRPVGDYPDRVAVNERFGILREAFIECNGPSEVDPTKSYAALGGSYLMIPGMIELLRANGYTGLRPSDFLGLSSMASLAMRMQRVPAF
jgi:hypothetical protein